MILIIESSAPFCSVALTDTAGKNVLQLMSEQENAHAEKLPVLVRSLLEKAGVGTSDLSAVAVSGGPGSYTGLRIGTSLAKGICYAASIPLISLSGLRGMYEEARTRVKAGYFLSHLDARRNEIYAEIYREDGDVYEGLSAVVLQSETYAALAGTQVAVCGNSTEKILQICSFDPEPVVVQLQPEAKFLCKESMEKYNKNQFEDVAYFEPLYLKDFVPGVTKKFSL